MITLHFAHYLSLAVLTVIPAFATVFGTIGIAKAALKALDTQPAQEGAIKKIFFTGIALSETVMLCVLGMVAYLFNQPLITSYDLYIRLSICILLIFPASIIGYCGPWSIAQTIYAAARQPQLSNNILSFMLITQSLMQTPVIFCTVFAALIQASITPTITFTHTIQLCALGVLLATASIGPCLGLSYFVYRASVTLPYNRHAFGKLFSFTFISQAIIETPFLLSLALGMFMYGQQVDTPAQALAAMCAAIVLGFAALPTSLASAYASSRALLGMAQSPDYAAQISRISFFCQAFIDTTAIYGLILALMLIYLA